MFSDVAAAGGTLVETNTMPETNFTITQGTLTMGELGNSVPYSGKLDDLSKFPVVEIINKVLKNDATKAFDQQAYLQFNSCALRGVSTSATHLVVTTNGTATATNTTSYASTHAKLIVDSMKERNIPAYIDDDYYAIAWPTTLRVFKNNLESIHQYTESGFRLIMNGEIGRYENVRYVEQTNIAKGLNTTGAIVGYGTQPTAWAGASSDWIFFFGNDTVAEAVAIPEEMRGKIPTDFGRSKGVAWYYLGGFGIVHNDSGARGNTRIFKWDSVA